MSDKPEYAENVVELGVPVEQVWEAITTPAGLTSFMADQVEVEPGVGGHIQLGWGGEMMAPGTIDAWVPGRLLRLHGNGIGEEWLLEGRGGATAVRLVFSGYGDTDWDETYDAFDATGALILEMLLSWLDEHHGAGPTDTRVTARLPLDTAAAWAAALGSGGLGVTADPDAIGVGDSFALTLQGGDPVPAQLRTYGVRNEALFAIPEWNGARLLLMVRHRDDASVLTLGLTTYDASATEAAQGRLERTTRAMEKQFSN